MNKELKMITNPVLVETINETGEFTKIYTILHNKLEEGVNQDSYTIGFTELLTQITPERKYRRQTFAFESQIKSEHLERRKNLYSLRDATPNDLTMLVNLLNTNDFEKERDFLNKNFLENYLMRDNSKNNNNC